MTIVVNPANGVPVYRQITDQVRMLAEAGAFAAGERIPSIRELASRLGVNPLTVQKAYDLLAAEGVLSKEHGRGVFVNPDGVPTLGRAERERRLRARMLDVAGEGLRLGVTPARQIRIFTETLERLGDQP